jgi:O-antigen ligase
VFAVAWVVSCLAIVPVALLPYQFDLNNASWVNVYDQHRVLIWKHTADQILQTPIFGRGADMSYVLFPIINETLPQWKVVPTLSSHPHNLFLQTWFELGAVGAILLTAFGLAFLSRVHRLAPRHRSFAYAMLACAGFTMHTSFGMWQIWYVALLGLSVVLFALGRRAMDHRNTAELPMQDKDCACHPERTCGYLNIRG